MSRDVPTIDELYGHGTEEAEAFEEHLEDLRQDVITYYKMHAGDLTTATELIYDPVITKLYDENRKLEDRLVAAGEDIEYMRAKIADLESQSTSKGGE